MQYQSVLNSITRGVLAPVYLLYGEEDYLQELLVKKLQQHLVNRGLEGFNYDELDGSKAKPAQIVSIANILPVLAEKRLVVVKNPAFLQSSSKETEEEPLLKYLADPSLSTCLVFWARGSIDKRKKIVKAIVQAGTIIEFAPLKGSELVSWLKEEAKTLGKKLEPQALQYLVLHSGNKLHILKNELEKLALYAGSDNSITLSMTEELVTKSSEANIFAMVDNLGLKKGEAALEELKNLMTAGEPPVRVLFMIARQFRLLLQAKELAKKGFTAKQVTSELSLHAFVTGKILKQAKNFSFDELEDSLSQILECDVAMKTGMPPRQALEDLILKLAYKKVM